jgi:hypothetical protein
VGRANVGACHVCVQARTHTDTQGAKTCTTQRESHVLRLLDATRGVCQATEAQPRTCSDFHSFLFCDAVHSTLKTMRERNCRQRFAFSSSACGPDLYRSGPSFVVLGALEMSRGTDAAQEQLGAGVWGAASHSNLTGLTPRMNSRVLKPAGGPLDPAGAMDRLCYIVSQPFPILLWAGLARGQGWRGRRATSLSALPQSIGSTAPKLLWPDLRTL